MNIEGIVGPAKDQGHYMVNMHNVLSTTVKACSAVRSSAYAFLTLKDCFNVRCGVLSLCSFNSRLSVPSILAIQLRVLFQMSFFVLLASLNYASAFNAFFVCSQSPTGLALQVFLVALILCLFGGIFVTEFGILTIPIGLLPISYICFYFTLSFLVILPRLFFAFTMESRRIELPVSTRPFPIAVADLFAVAFTVSSIGNLFFFFSSSHGPKLASVRILVSDRVVRERPSFSYTTGTGLLSWAYQSEVFA